MVQIQDILLEKNTWWKAPEKFSAEYKDRTIYKKIKHYLKERQILALVGLRRTGKTTLMMKIVEDALNDNYNSNSIIFFTFDELKNIEIREILKVYAELNSKNIADGKLLLLLDEVQKLSNWQDQLKHIYDTYKNIKVIISGSESLFIRKKSQETLSGRLFEFKIKQLSFKEFLSFKEIKIDNPKLYAKELETQFKEFLISGGLPELVDKTDKEFIRKYIKESIINSVIFKDIPTLYPVKDPAVLESILNIFIDNPGQIIDINKLSIDLNLFRHTVSAYLRYLEDSFLLIKLYNFSKNKRTSERKLKKFYPSICSIYLSYQDTADYASKVFENMVVIQTDAKFFWRDAYKNEVDIVLAVDDILPIEVKYGSDLDTTGLKIFMHKFKAKNGLIISKNEEKHLQNEKIDIIPAYRYFYGIETK